MPDVTKTFAVTLETHQKWNGIHLDLLDIAFLRPPPNCKENSENGSFSRCYPKNDLIGSPLWPYRRDGGYVIPPKIGWNKISLHLQIHQKWCSGIGNSGLRSKKKSCHPIQDDSTSPNHTFQAHSISFLLEYSIQQRTNNQPKEVRSQSHRKEVYE